MASPFTNPNITGWGIKRTNLPSFNSPKTNCKTPIKMTANSKYPMAPSIPTIGICLITSGAKIIATAPVAPEIIPGRPPKMEVMSPIINAAYSPNVGSTWATNEKAIASGTKAKDTVSPDKISFFKFFGFGIKTKSGNEMGP